MTKIRTVLGSVTSPVDKPHLLVDMSSIRYINPSIARVRDMALGRDIVSPRIEFKNKSPESMEISEINTHALEAAQSGRLMDFGEMSNDVIQKTYSRGAALWCEGVLGMPFKDPWLLYFTIKKDVFIYLINPWGSDPGSSFEICELIPFNIPGYNDILYVGDRGMFPGKNISLGDFLTDDTSGDYTALVMPGSHRDFLRYEEDKKEPDKLRNQQAAKDNLSNAIMSSLTILNTRGVRREIMTVSAKLNKARLKSGKPPIPPHERVITTPYVTAISDDARAREHGESTGTRASPIPHIRRGHFREYESGKKTFINDMLINVTEEQRDTFRSARSHYEVKP